MTFSNPLSVSIPAPVSCAPVRARSTVAGCEESAKLTASVPAPPNSVSSPMLPEIVSLPAPPSIVSLPEPPSSVSPPAMSLPLIRSGLPLLLDLEHLRGGQRRARAPAALPAEPVRAAPAGERDHVERHADDVCVEVRVPAQAVVADGQVVAVVHVRAARAQQVVAALGVDEELDLVLVRERLVGLAGGEAVGLEDLDGRVTVVAGRRGEVVGLVEDQHRVGVERRRGAASDLGGALDADRLVLRLDDQRGVVLVCGQAHRDDAARGRAGDGGLGAGGAGADRGQNGRAGQRELGDGAFHRGWFLLGREGREGGRSGRGRRCGCAR